MKYCTDDGKHVFDSQEEYDAYEKKIIEEKAKAEELKQNKKKRLMAINNASKALYNEIKTYEKDYGEKPRGVEVHLVMDKDVAAHDLVSPFPFGYVRGFFDI